MLQSASPSPHNGIAVHQSPGRLLLSVNESLSTVTGTTWSTRLPWAVWRKGWKDHQPRSATCISELKTEAMSGLALAGITGDRRRFDLALVRRPQYRDGVRKA